MRQAAVDLETHVQELARLAAEQQGADEEFAAAQMCLCVAERRTPAERFRRPRSGSPPRSALCSKRNGSRPARTQPRRPAAAGPGGPPPSRPSLWQTWGAHDAETCRFNQDWVNYLQDSGKSLAESALQGT